MSVQGIGGPGFSGLPFPSLMGAPDQTADTTFANAASAAAGSSATSDDASGGSAGAASPGAGALSGANALLAMNGLNVTGAVTATLPDGITVGIYSFAPQGSDQGQAGASGGSSSGSSSSSGPDYAAMTAALEQMVDAFMHSDFAGSSSTSAAAAAYQQSSPDSPTQTGAAGTVA